MAFFGLYLKKIVNYDLMNTFSYKNLTSIPKFKKIILNFGIPNLKLKYFLSSLLALEFLTNKKGKITKAKHLNIFFKIKKGDPVGCKIILKKSTIHSFYLKLGTAIFSNIKQSQIPKLQWNSKLTKAISFQLKNPLLFTELENQFQHFKDIPQLDIVLLTNCKSSKEFLFLLQSIKIFPQYKKRITSKSNSVGRV